jgi:regulator of protease activity HflC (stomatin/prohibitin superfamily)
MWNLWQFAVGSNGSGGASSMLWIIPVVVVALILIVNSVRILKEYERGVVLRFGRFHVVKMPGIRLILPWIDKMTKMPLRIITKDIPAQEVITRDTVSVKVNAVLYFRVVDPKKAFLEVEEYIQATFQIAQTTLRSVLGQAELDDLLAERDKLNDEIQRIVDSLTEPWGVKVTAVEIKDVELTEQLTRAMAKVAEAERERRAKVIHAEGEAQASEKLAEAAHVLATEPTSIQLRYLQTLTEIAVEKNSTILFPLPIELIRPIIDLMNKKEKNQ